jgi:hypothetical protein
MRKRLLPLLAVLGLMLAARPVFSADEKAPGKAKPAIVLQIKALDDLIADGRYLFALAEQAEFGKQLEKMLQARTGPKGLDGIDTKKPIGLYGSLKAKVDRSEAILLLPIADEKAFLALLETLDVSPKKGEGGLYSAEVEKVPFPVLFRFANGYLYATLKSSESSADLLAKDKLPLPATVLGAGAGDLVSLTLNLDQIPSQLKDLVGVGIDTALDTEKDKEPPGETKAQKAFREAAIDEVARQAKAVLADGAALAVRLNVDRKTDDLTLELSVAGKAGSALAKDIKALGAFKSVAASLVDPKSAVNAGVAVRLPEAVRKYLGPVVDEAIQKALDNEADENKRELVKILFNSLKPTAKSGAIDFGIDLRGPSKKGLYTAVAGTSVVEGEGIEQALKKILAKLPEEAKAPIALDVARSAGVNVHRITVEKGKMDEKQRKAFGEGPIYFAIRTDAVFVSFGPEALVALKEAVATAPKAGNPLQFEVSLARIAKLAGEQQKAFPGAAAKAFKGNGSDKVRLSIEAGSVLKLKLNAKAQIVTLGALLKKAQDEGE